MILPPLTAVCVTQPGREGLLLRAIENFRQQTYDGDKQLNIYPRTLSHMFTVRDLLGISRRPGVTQTGEVRVIDPSPPAEDNDMYWTLRCAVSHANDRKGLFAIWDDDNQFHPMRLMRQAYMTFRGTPSYLSAGMWLYHDSKELFVHDLDVKHDPMERRVLPWTLVCAVEDITDDMLPKQYAGSPTSALGYSVLKRFNPNRPYNEWWWTVTGVRGDNANGYEWHRQWVEQEKRSFDVSWMAGKQVLMRHWLDQFKWDDQEIDACARDGVAFAYKPVQRWPVNFLPVGDPVGIQMIKETHDGRSEEEANEVYEEEQSGQAATN